MIDSGEVSPASLDGLHLNQDRGVVRLPRSPDVGRLVAMAHDRYGEAKLVPLHALKQQEFSLARSISHIQGNKQPLPDRFLSVAVMAAAGRCGEAKREVD